MDRREITLYFVVLVALILLKSNVLTMPYFWDAMGMNAVPNALHIYDGDFGYLFAKENNAHPPLFYFILAGCWRLFGQSLLVSHLLVLFFGFIGLAYTYKLGKHLFDSDVGVIALLLLLFNQLFFAQVGILNLEVPALALAAATVYYYVGSSRRRFFIFASLLVLMKESSIVILFAIFLHHLIRGNPRKSSLYYLSPLVFLLLWFFLHWLGAGWALHPTWVDFYQFNLEGMTSIAVFFFDSVFKHLVYDYSITAVNRYNFILNLFIVSYFYQWLAEGRSYIRSSESLLPLTVLLTFIMFSVTVQLPRYLLLAYPFYYILAAASLNFHLRSYLKWPAVLLIVLIFTFNYTGERQVLGHFLETNLEYLDLVSTHRAAASFLEQNYAEATVVAVWPTYFELREPRNGYVSRRLETLSYNPLTFPEERGQFMVYDSGQTYPITPELNQSRLQHIITFEKNGKTTRVYSYSG